MKSCRCREITAFLGEVGVLGDSGQAARCGVCVDAILEGKAEAVREVTRLQKIIDGLVTRVACQSELLTARSEK